MCNYIKGINAEKENKISVADVYCDAYDHC
jgi:hypothetical protein